MRTVLWIIVIAIPIMLLVTTLDRFGKEGVDRVEVTLLEQQQQPAPLLPGDAQSYPWKGGARYGIVTYWKNTPIANGVITDMGVGLTYHIGASAKEIDVKQAGPDHLSLLVVNYDLKTQKAEQLHFLKIDRAAGQITFRFPK